MISSEATELNAYLRQELKETRAFEQPVDDVRVLWEEFGQSIPNYSPDITIEPVDAEGVGAEWVTAPGVTGDRVLLQFHGGGFVIGHPDTYRNFNARISEALGARVLAADYRLAPESPFPAAVDDTLATYKWALSQGHKPENIGFVGESAGGNLVLSTLLAARDAGLPLPAAAVAISPWFDLSLAGHTHASNEAADPMIGPGLLGQWAEEYLNGADAKSPLASPVFGDLSGLPPIYLMAGSTEVLLDDTHAMFEKLSKAGVDVRAEIVPEMPHIWPIFAYQIPEGQLAISRMAAFFGEHLIG